MNRRTRRLWWIPASVLIVIVFAGPLVVLMFHAFAARWPYPALLPEIWSFRGMRFLVRNAGGIVTAILSSFVYSLATVFLSLFLSIAPDRVLARYDFRGRLLLEALLLSPVLVPAITYGMGIHHLFIRLGLANRMTGVILVLTASAYPYMLRALIAGFEQFDSDYEICAENLGADAFRRLVVVTIPMLVPAIVAGSTVVFLVAFSDYFLVFLIGGGAVRSFTGYLFPFLSAGDRAIGSSLTILFLLVPLLLFVCMELVVRKFYDRRSPGYNGNDGAQTDSTRIDRVDRRGAMGKTP